MYFRHLERPLWNLHKEMIKRRSITQARDTPAIATALSKCSGCFTAPGQWVRVSVHLSYPPHCLGSNTAQH